MSRPPSDEPPVGALVPPNFGLSKTELADLIKSMLAVVWRVGCPVHIRPLEVVHDAFVVALCKPISERPAITERKKFVAWMCTLAEYCALTNRKSKHRRLLGEGQSDAEMAVLLSAAGHADAIAAREVLHEAFLALEPADQALIVARHIEGKTITEIAAEQDQPRSTVYSRYARAIGILQATIRAMIAAAILLIANKARAQALRLTRLVAHATQTTCATAVTVTCGMLVPTGSQATVVHQDVAESMSLALPTSTNAAITMPMEPPSFAVVAPDEPETVDMLGKQCSASDMKSTKIASYLQGTVLPFAFLVAPAVTHLACSGAERQTPPPQEPEERDDSTDPYEMMCDNEHRRGDDCPSKAEWYESMGRCPDGTHDCQK